MQIACESEDGKYVCILRLGDKEHRMENAREDRASANPNCKIGIHKKYNSALLKNR